MQALSSLYVVKSGSKRSRENIAVYQFKIDVGISIELAKLNYKTRKTKEFVKVFLHLMLLSVMHVISWKVCSFILPGLSWIICVFVRRPTHKNTVARNSLDLDLLGQWSCTIVAVIKMHIWHGVGRVDVQMRTCLRLYNEKIWIWRNVQKDQWAIWAEAVSGHLTSSSGAFSLSFSLSR